MGGSSIRSRLSRRGSFHEPGFVPPPNSLASSKISVGALSLGEVFDGSILDEDIAIAQNLLAGNPPIIPPRRSSFGYAGTANPRPVLMDDIASSTHSIEVNNRRRGYNATSNTWTSSSGEISETDDVDNRTSFVQEYNKISSQYGIPVIVPDEYEAVVFDKVTISAKQGSWIMRRLLKRTSSMLAIKPQKDLKHKRSISDFSIRMQAARKDTLKDKHLTELVRLCGSSPFYLPTEYAAGTLSLPTCFRATAQYLVQRGPALRGIFRINGSHTTVAALYDHYASQDDEGDAISGTVRCPTLPDNIQCDEHDVASAFKKFLSGLPGGILGKIWLFEALVSIHNQLGIDPELTKTRQTKVRARLIACAISSHPSRFQRDLICAVFGLLCMIGRAAETAVREDDAGRPLPTHGLMGYSPLGTIFGPLLLGDLMDEYDPHREEKSLVDSIQSKTPPKKEKKTKHKKNKSAEESLMESKLASEKMKVANRVAEMLITHWRDVIRHMKNMGSMTDAVVESRKLKEKGLASANVQQPLLRPSASESFFLRRPPDWDAEERPGRYAAVSGSPTPSDRNPLKPTAPMLLSQSRSTQSLVSKHTDYHQPLRRQRSRPKTHSSQMLNGTKSMNILTPPKEDREDTRFDDIHSRMQENKFPRRPENNYPTTSSDSTITSSTKKGTPPANEMNAASTSAFKAGTFKERNSARSPRLLRKSSPFKASISKVNESEGYEGSAEGDQPSSGSSTLLKEREPSNNVAKPEGIDGNETTDIVRESPFAKSVPLPSSEIEAPLAQRYYQSPSDHLERVLSIHASPVEKNGRVSRYRATDPAHAFSTTNPINKSGFRSSFSPSDEYSFHHNDDANPAAYNRSRYFKDPLKRISKAEDMASLQSLGQAMASSTDGSDDVPSLSFSDQAAKYAAESTSTSGTRSPTKSFSQEMTPGRLPRASVDKFRPSDSPKATAEQSAPVTPSTIKHRISNPTNPANTPVTPKNEPRATGPVFKGRLNSVKSLAAKFDNQQAQKSPTPTSVSRLTAGSRERASTLEVTTPSAASKRDRGSAMVGTTPLATPSSVLASYTSNPSPSPSRASMKSRNSVKSTRSITINQAQRQRRLDASENASPRRTPAPPGSQGFRPATYIANKLFRNSTSSPKLQDRRRSSKKSDEDREPTNEKSNLTTAATSFSVTPIVPGIVDMGSSFAGSAMLPQGGDGNASFNVPRPGSRPPSIARPPSMPRMASLGKILPRPMEPPVAQYISTRNHPELPRSTDSPSLSGDHLSRQSASPSSSLVSPTFFQPFMRMTPEGFAQGQGQMQGGSSAGSGGVSVWQGRGASMLYAQVTSMQKLMDAKNEEIDNLKRQLATKNSLNDLGTLSEQLREQKRETAMWRNRALTAEKRLERMSQLVPVGTGRSELRGEVGSLLSETSERLEQSFIELTEAEKPSGVDGADAGSGQAAMGGDSEMTPRAAARQEDSGSGPESARESNPAPASAPASSGASSSGSGPGSSGSASGSGSGSGSGSSSGKHTASTTSTTIRTTTMHGGGMDGVMSSEESQRTEQSEQSQGTVLRHGNGRRSTVDLLDFGSEDSGCVLVAPLVPEVGAGAEGRVDGEVEVGTKGVGEHVEELFELA